MRLLVFLILTFLHLIFEPHSSIRSIRFSFWISQSNFDSPVEKKLKFFDLKKKLPEFFWTILHNVYSPELDLFLFQATLLE